MTCIKHIKIRNFRSIKTLDMDTTESTVLIGQNDSGKSNILRALNLFFNNETSYKTPFNFDSDFSFFSACQKRQSVRIELEIELPDNYHKTNGQRIIWAKRWLRTKTDHKSKYYGLIGKSKKILLPPKSNVHILLDQINFIYVPAIKDAKYFDELRGDIYSLVSGVAGKFRASSSAFEASISEHLKSLTDEISKKLNLDTKLALPRDMGHIFERLDFQSGPFSVSLENRGDGVKARHIPIILSFMAKQKKKLQRKGATPHTFIWGYEEPENNIEMSRCFEMHSDFSSMSNSHVEQLFLTTHSPIFCEIGTYKGGCLHHIYFNEKDSTTSIATEDAGFEDLMGITKFISPYISQAKSDFDTEKKLREVAEDLLEQSKSWLCVEDEYDQIYKVAWLELNGITFTKDNLEKVFSAESPFSISGFKGVGGVTGFLRAKNIDMQKKLKIIGLFDFDEAGSRGFHSLTKDKDYWEEENLGERCTGFYKKRFDHPHFYAMLLPIPDRLSTLADLEFSNFANYVEIENLLPDDFLTANCFVETKKAAGNTNYLKIKDCKNNLKKNLWKKAIGLQKKDFTDFTPLFKTIEKLICSDI